LWIHANLKDYRETVVVLESPDDFDLAYAKSELARLPLERAHTACGGIDALFNTGT